MITAATSMIAQLGEIDPKYTPSADVTAPPRPRTNPSLGTQVLLRKCVAAPERDVGMMANRLVAVAA